MDTTDLTEKYNAWNLCKKELSTSNKKFFFKEGEIWWASLGLNIGSESFGKGETFRRPLLVIRKLSADSCIVVPLTSKEKKGTWFGEVLIHGQPKWAMLHQIRMIHTKRFQRRFVTLDKKSFSFIKEKLETLLELS